MGHCPLEKLKASGLECHQTLVPPHTSSEAGAVAALVESRKKAKYGSLDPVDSFAPIAPC